MAKKRTFIKDLTEVRNLEEEILGLRIQEEEGFIKFTELQKDAINDAEKMLGKMKKSRDYSEKSKKEWGELAKTMKGGLDFEQGSESIMKRIVDLKRKEKTLP